MDDYQLMIEPGQQHIFVTQLREDDDNDANEDIKQIPIIKEKAGSLLARGINTLQSTLLLRKELEVDKIHAELESKKREFTKRIDACKKREGFLKEKQTEIKDRIDKFDKFIKENEAKRKRAVKKYQQETKIKEHKSQELESLKAELQLLMIKHKNLKATLEKHGIFENYLTKVVDSFPEDYLDATDNVVLALMMRYHTLNSTNESLLQKLNKSSDEVEQGQQMLQDLKMKHTQQLLVFNGELATLQKRLENMIEENVKLEHKWSQSRTTERDQSQTLGQIKIAIENISDRCLTHRYGANERLSYERRLDIIGGYLLERESVLRIASTS